MRFLLDQGVARGVGGILREAGHEAVHVGESEDNPGTWHGHYELNDYCDEVSDTLTGCPECGWGRAESAKSHML